jgi:hypothetical protein
MVFLLNHQSHTWHPVACEPIGLHISLGFLKLHPTSFDWFIICCTVSYVLNKPYRDAEVTRLYVHFW